MGLLCSSVPVCTCLDHIPFVLSATGSNNMNAMSIVLLSIILAVFIIVVVKIEKNKKKEG